MTWTVPLEIHCKAVFPLAGSRRIDSRSVPRHGMYDLKGIRMSVYEDYPKTASAIVFEVELIRDSMAHSRGG
jgi:hypothetical protein